MVALLLQKRFVMQDAYVHYSVNNTVGIIEFYTPHHNSLPSKVLSLLASSITEAAKDDACKVIVLKSAGDKTFCAGASFDELMAIETTEQGLAFLVVLLMSSMLCVYALNS